MIRPRHTLELYSQREKDFQTQPLPSNELVKMLFDTALESLLILPVLVERQDQVNKVREINRVMCIIYDLREMIDFERGGEFALSLSKLYSGMNQNLLEASKANSKNQLANIQHVANILQQIKNTWDKAPDISVKNQCLH
ncbi:MAG: flagellar export chaperone FliS [Methylococcales bacterium]|nr:flagellar export chaperone FliS [Methylococcales bacterium]